MAQKRVLLVDDDVDTVQMYRALLESAGHVVAAAYDGTQALSIAASHPPDAAVLNISMPGMDGLELCRRLRSMPWGKDIVIIALSGWGRSRDRKAARDAGFDHYFVKPAKLDDLLASIGRNLSPL